MADSNHVKKLREGVAAWNQWRSENSDVSIDLSDADLRDVELPGANLRMANLNSCDFRDANLDHADLSSATLRSTNLKGARLRAASLSKADAFGAYLSEVDASDADFREAILTKSEFDRAKLLGANMSKATCKDSHFIDAELNRSYLTRTDFRDSNLRNAQFVEASLEGADLRRCQLVNASFNSANLSWANLRQTHLNDVDLAAAKLTHADLRKVVGLSCDQLTQAQDWAAAYRDAELACGATIPSSDGGVVIEVPTAEIAITGHPPTVTVTTAEEIDKATRQRFNAAPATVVAEARRAIDTTIALQTTLRDMRLNSPEAGHAQALLEKQVNALDNIVAMLQPDGDKEAAQNTFRDLLHDVLESYLKVLADKGVTRGILATAAIASLSLTGVDVSFIIAALVAAPIIGIEALKKILSGFEKMKDRGE